MEALIGYYVFIAAVLLLLQAIDHVRDSRERERLSGGLRFKSSPSTKRLHSRPVNGE